MNPALEQICGKANEESKILDSEDPFTDPFNNCDIVLTAKCKTQFQCVPASAFSRDTVGTI
jgi:hypothetical protein